MDMEGLDGRDGAPWSFASTLPVGVAGTHVLWISLGALFLAGVLRFSITLLNGPRRPALDHVALFLAHGFGSGLLKPAPGTWGSLVGIGWLWLLLLPGSPAIFLIGTLLGIGVSIGICQTAERLLKTHDPSSVVIDEIAAMPLTWLGVLGMHAVTNTSWLGSSNPDFLRLWPELLIAFTAFRLLDVWKPGWIGKSQELPGGWGVTADDVLAGLFASIPVGAVAALRHIGWFPIP